MTETYDDNISLFGNSSTPRQQRLRLVGRPGRRPPLLRPSTRVLDLGYGGSFLNYRTFSVLNRWDQRAEVEFRRQENARLNWFGARQRPGGADDRRRLSYNGVPSARPAR